MTDKNTNGNNIIKEQNENYIKKQEEHHSTVHDSVPYRESATHVKADSPPPKKKD